MENKGKLILTLLRPEGSRRAGRPKLSWLDGVEEDLRTLDFKGWRRGALDRDRWKEVLKAGCNAISNRSSSSSSSSSKYKLGSSSLWSVLHSPLSSVLGPQDPDLIHTSNDLYLCGITIFV